MTFSDVVIERDGNECRGKCVLKDEGALDVLYYGKGSPFPSLCGDPTIAHEFIAVADRLDAQARICNREDFVT